LARFGSAFGKPKRFASKTHHRLTSSVSCRFANKSRLSTIARLALSICLASGSSASTNRAQRHDTIDGATRNRPQPLADAAEKNYNNTIRMIFPIDMKSFLKFFEFARPAICLLS
jgi:hypothetical protein